MPGGSRANDLCVCLSVLLLVLLALITCMSKFVLSNAQVVFSVAKVFFFFFFLSWLLCSCLFFFLTIFFTFCFFLHVFHFFKFFSAIAFFLLYCVCRT